MSTTRPLPRGLAELRELLEMIKFQHSLFALPFAFTGMLAAARGLPDLATFALIVGAMVAARTAAMTWNRIADRRFDAQNPRTRDRALPAGRVGLGGASTLLAASVAAFVACAAALNPLALALAPVALVVVLGYSLTKRFTWATHFVLGLSLAIAPAGAWVAVRGSLDVAVVCLSLAVALWTAGFDILYSCQDVEFDRDHGLRSVPVRWGVPGALGLARSLHVATALALALFGLVDGRGPAYFVAVVLAAAVMAWSHSLVRPGDLTRVGMAFFQANVAVSLLVMLGTGIDLLALTASPSG